MAFVFVDVEAFGGAPCVGRMTEFGAIEYKTGKSFHGILWKASPDPEHPVTSRLDPDAVQKTEEERKQVILEFETWLKQFGDRRLIMISDNPAYDFQWINDACWKYLGYNPFGHSARRIGDFYAGLVGDFAASSKWKKYRVTPHDHHPVHDCRGNVESMRRIIEKFKPKGFSKLS